MTTKHTITISLSQSDWEELMAALESKALVLEQRDQNRDESADEFEAEEPGYLATWVEQLRGIYRAIAPLLDAQKIVY